MVFFFVTCSFNQKCHETQERNVYDVSLVAKKRHFHKLFVHK